MFYREEEARVQGVLSCGDWGFPLSTLEFRLFVKSYLDSSGRDVRQFENNRPGQANRLRVCCHFGGEATR